MSDEYDSNNLIEVVAGVITDARGRILLARRTEGRDLAGLWEFPGGKREPDETAEAALARELHEELGIDVELGPPLICVPQQYPHKRLRLDVRHIASWRGAARGHEGQALAWVPPHLLGSYPMPPADRPVVAALQQSDRYLVTPSPPAGGDAAWLDGLRRALDAGIGRAQVRLHGLDAARQHKLVAAAAGICAVAGIDLLLNGEIEMAHELGTGLHLRAAQLPGLQERPVGKDVLLAASCHDVAELRMAERLGCDFAVVGPLKPTPSHPELAGIGWERFERLREHASLPIYAIGGLAPDDIATARRHGAQGIAAIRGLWTGMPPSPACGRGLG